MSSERDVSDGDAPERDSSLELEIEGMHNRLDALSTQVSTVREELRAAEEERDALREENAALREEIEALHSEVERLDARTDMLKLVEQSDDMGPKQRSVALIQHLRRAARRQRDRGRDAAASVNREEAETALHHPDLQRTTIYSDMRRAVRLVGNEDVLWYESSTGGDSRLKLDLEAGDLPGDVVGRATDDGGR